MTLKRRAIAGTALATAAALALSACGGSDDDSDGDDTAAQGGDVTWAIASSFNNWYLHTSAGNSSYLRQILSPMSPELGDFHPDDGSWVINDAIVAEEPTLVSEEPMQVQIKLNPDANWGDGNPVRLEDFIYTWHQRSGNEEWCSDKCDPLSTDGYEQIESIEEPEEGTILITYEEGYADPEWLYTAYLRKPSHVAEEQGFTDWMTDPEQMGDSVEWFASNPPTWSTGPYLPVEAELGEFVKYEPNPDYAGSVQPKLDSLTLEVIEDTESIITEARQGTIDGSWPNTFTMDQLEQLDDTPEMVYETYEGSIWIHLNINSDNEFLSDQTLRSAVFTAIDVNELIERNFQGIDVDRKLNPFFTRNSQYYEPVPTLEEQGTGDVDGAIAMLEDAGYTLDGDTLMSPDGEAVSFDFRFGGSDEIRKTIAELVQAKLAEIGITVELNPIPDDALGDVVGGKEFDMVIFGWSGNPAFVVAPNQYFGDDSPYSYTPKGNEELQDAIDGVSSTFDLDEAAEYANEAAELAAQTAVQLPVLDEPQAIIYGDYLVGVAPNGNSQAGPMWNVQEWGVSE